METLQRSVPPAWTFIAILILCLSAVVARADEVSDSLEFMAKRRQILESPPDERKTLSLVAAEELAREGYFTEALDLLAGMEDSAASAKLEEDFLSDTTVSVSPDSLDTLSGIPPLGVKSPAGHWSGSVQTSANYDQWEGEDNPYSGHVRAKLEWIQAHSPLERLTAVFQGSDQNAYFDFAAKGSFWNRILKLESEALSEKRIGQAYGDSLDRAFLVGRAELTTRPLGKPLSANLQMRVEAEQFRFDRFGSRSSRSYWVGPSLEAVSEDLRKSLIISWEINQTEYPNLTTAGYFRHGPTAWAEWYGPRLSVDAETRYQTYRYMRDTSLYRQQDLETRASVFVRTWPWLKVGLRTLGETELDDYRDSLGVTTLNAVKAAYHLSGSTWTLQPQLVWEWASAYSTTMSLAYRRGDYPVVRYVDGLTLEFPRYLEAPYTDWRAELGCTVLGRTIFLTLSAYYETNTATSSSIYITGSSAGAGGNGNLSWQLRPWLEIDATGMVERRMDNGTLPGRIQDMTSLSLGFTLRLP